MVKCVFCGKEEESFRGVHLIRNIGVVNYYCSNKCRKNALKLERDKRTLKWTEAFHITRDKARVKEKAAEDAAGVPAEVKKVAKKKKSA